MSIKTIDIVYNEIHQTITPCMLDANAPFPKGEALLLLISGAHLSILQLTCH